MIRFALAIPAVFLFGLAEAEAQQSIHWTTLDQLDHRSRSYVKLDEDESVKEIGVAQVRLSEKTPKGRPDALLVHHQSSYNCGSGGCLLEVLMEMPDGTMKKVVDLLANDVSLGKDYTKGVRNLRFDDAVTWIWNGRTFVLK